jgi:tetratricopeptide (TPR) repeat protein
MLQRVGALGLLLSVVLGLAMPIVGMAGSLPKITVNRVDLTQKLNAARFETLNAELSAYEIKAEKDPRFEMNAMAAFSAFECDSPLIASGVSNWVKASPDSYAALTARATCFVSAAQRVRGTAYEVRDPSAVSKYLADAVRDANEAIKIHERLAPAYALKIKAARIGGTQQDVKSAGDEALSIVPWSFNVREQLMYAARPRWGGSRQQMQTLADTSQYYLPQNPGMQFLKAWIPLDEGDDFADGSHWAEAIQKYTQALETGGEYWTTYRRRAHAYYALQQWQKAFDDAMRSNQLYPENSENLAMLAFAANRLENPEASVLYLADYLRFEIPEPQTADLLTSDQALLKAQGKEKW